MGPVVLVFSTDTLGAALIAAAVELSGFTPVFPLLGEHPRDALMRVRPRVAIVDCDHADACSENFFGPAMMIGARVAVFSSTRSVRTLDPIAEHFGVRTFAMPLELSELGSLLGELARTVET